MYLFKKTRIGIVAILVAVSTGLFASSSNATSAVGIDGADFESGDFSGWNIGNQTGDLTGGNITGSGTGVTIFSGGVTFSASAHAAVGQPIVNGTTNPYYAPAVTAATWNFQAYGTKAAALQPKGSSTFDQAIGAVGLSSTDNQAIKNILITQRNLSGLGSPTPTDAAWITRSVTLSANTTYTMAWNYIGTDYVPFNDGSIATLVTTSATAGSTVIVNNGVSNYALLGFTNPGTGDYSTGHFGSTGWQLSTYRVSITGEYILGFMVFNLGDTALSPVLLIDSQPGQTLKNGVAFGAVTPNNPNAPTVTTAPPTLPAPSTTPPTTGSPTTQPPVESVPSTVPAPIVNLVTATLDLGQGSCIVSGTLRSATASAISLGYMYLPGPSECFLDGFMLAGWAPSGAITTSATLPLLSDPSDGVERYFIANSGTFSAVWQAVEAVPGDSAPGACMDCIPDNQVNPNPGVGELPKTGAETDFTGLIAFIILVSGYGLFRVAKRKK